MLSSINYDKSYGYDTEYNGSTNAFNMGNFGANFSSTFTLNASGLTTSVAVNDGVPKTSAYALDGAGQIIRRDETRTEITVTGAITPKLTWH